MFRRHALVIPFAEGWGLYAERLADEMGLYSTDLDRLGMLSADSWRAGRLVVDTGIHALGWTRQRAVDFLTSWSAVAPSVIEVEVDRYIGVPGQALAYKMGQLEISRLRADAERRLGSRFDISGFHDTVLTSGSVTLGVLGDQVRRWVEASMIEVRTERLLLRRWRDEDRAAVRRISTQTLMSCATSRGTLTREAVRRPRRLDRAGMG